jgi:hypothetical protein
MGLGDDRNDPSGSFVARKKHRMVFRGEGIVRGVDDLNGCIPGDLEIVVMRL